jgi:hypothetical protein
MDDIDKMSTYFDIKSNPILVTNQAKVLFDQHRFADAYKLTTRLVVVFVGDESALTT